MWTLAAYIQVRSIVWNLRYVIKAMKQNMSCKETLVHGAAGVDMCAAPNSFVFQIIVCSTLKKMILAPFKCYMI